MIPEITLEDIELVKRYMQEPFHIEYNGINVNLLWSGGADSTFLLLALLVKGCAVRTFHVNLLNNKVKNEREKEARDIIFDAVSKQYSGLIKNWSKQDWAQQEFDIPGSTRQSISQALYWLVATQTKTAGWGTAFAIGYVNGDDAIYYIPALQAIVDGFNMMCAPEDKITVSFPLARVKKSWCWDAMPEIISQHIVWCEAEKPGPDCQCAPCRRARFELKDLS
ncbi:putative alpha hydrolase [Erwinia phage phiEa2809]|uniref:Putative alpha hydrolase n=1 Tax=Erwinia phage phiEa2809 TaxID=1564096 RepID=A0A0A0YSM4_9CAUD|nr:QueC-like queuosine biosynthesis [Erwinia phage phiEa2809]AIX13025.1 putative alpha hydrolase [Erwinia phage phiEa2809]